MNELSRWSTTPGCALYGISARDGRSVVLIRRGPTKQVALLRWWLDGDRIEEGQWFKGYLYGRWCDLSPDGDYLLYFAGDQHRGAGNYGTWSAISHPPFLTALALWPKGDTWSGGGLFLGQQHIALAHSAHASDPKTLAPNFALPDGWRVTEFVPPLLTDAATGKPLPRLYSGTLKCCETGGRPDYSTQSNRAACST